jgi:hypothetical protein
MVAVAAWIPPLIEQFQSGGGNLSALWDYFTTSHPNTTGSSTGARIVATQLSVPSPWISGHERIAPFGLGLDDKWHVPFVLVFVVVGAVVAFRRRDRDLFMVNVLALMLAVAAWFAASHVVGFPYDYLLKWTWVVGAFGWFAIGLTIVRIVQPHLAGSRSWLVPATCCVVAGLAAACVVSAARARTPDPVVEHEIAELQPALLDAMRTRPAPTLVTVKGGILGGALGDAVLLQLVRARIKAGLDPAFDYVAGKNHVVPRRGAGSVLVVADGANVDQLLRDPRYQLIGQTPNDNNLGVGLFVASPPP